VQICISTALKKGYRKRNVTNNYTSPECISLHFFEDNKIINEISGSYGDDYIWMSSGKLRSLEEIDRLFGGAYCFHHQGEYLRSVSTRLHGATSQKTAIFNNIITIIIYYARFMNTTHLTWQILCLNGRGKAKWYVYELNRLPRN
jgi:hypothetical protein